MPDLFLIGGPNGAGKTTTALQLLQPLEYYEFVNADALASALSPFRPESVALQAGALMMRRLRQLAGQNINFATESTLSARAWVPFIRQCKAQGYNFNLLYIWLNSPDLAVERVARRVQSGGHDIPEEVIRRRYEAGRRNFVSLYRPLADSWRVYDNSSTRIVPVAEGHASTMMIYQPQTWQHILREEEDAR